MSEEITAAAVRILGTEEELLPALCTAAEAGLRARLRRDVDPEKECRECFVMAAALVCRVDAAFGAGAGRDGF